MARQVQVTDNDKTIIKQIMREKGITIEQLAERMGKARPTISNLLIKQNMTIDTHLQPLLMRLKWKFLIYFP